jgi:surface antigen
MKRALAAVTVLTTLLLGAGQAKATNCVAYVKSVTGFSLLGDAWQWWGAAADVYERGYAPAPGAVMVFSRTGRMHVGHVAVVRQVVGPREILIDQANWHHGRIDRGVSIRDLSPENDWSSVEVEWTKGVYGGPFPITGFVYAPGTPQSGERYATGSGEHYAPDLIEASNRVRSGAVVYAGGRQMLKTRPSVKEATRPVVAAGVASRHREPVRPASLAATGKAAATKPAVAPAKGAHAVLVKAKSSAAPAKPRQKATR